MSAHGASYAFTPTCECLEQDTAVLGAAGSAISSHEGGWQARAVGQQECKDTEHQLHAAARERQARSTLQFESLGTRSQVDWGLQIVHLQGFKIHENFNVQIV